MRSLLALGACLVLTPACERRPSSVPLGGDEWVPLARHVDRRPRSSESPSALVRSSNDAPRTESSAPVVASQAPPTVAAETSFGLVPLAAGSAVTLRTKYTVRAKLVTGAEEGGSSQVVEADAAERIAIRIASADARGPREVEIEYVESKASFRLDGAPEDQDSNLGKRYTVVFEGTEPRVSKVSGSLEPNEGRSVLFDLATVTGYWPLLSPHLPRSLDPGFRLRLDAKDVARAFGAQEDVQFEGSELTLRGLTQGNAVAIFDCRLPARFEKDGVSLRVQLAGTANVRTSDARPLEVSLSGALDAEQGALGEGASLSGTVSVELSHEYTAAK